MYGVDGMIQESMGSDEKLVNCRIGVKPTEWAGG